MHGSTLDKRRRKKTFLNSCGKKTSFKMSFFLWRAWEFRVPVDDVLQHIGVNIASKCWCCTRPKTETMSHLFLTSSIATKLWRLFANFAGIQIEAYNFHKFAINGGHQIAVQN